MLSERGRPRRSAVRARKNMQVAIRLDRDLILDCRNGDLGAWQRLLDRYERLVFSVPRRYGLSREDAADITQLTFTILFQSMDTLSEGTTLGAWLTTVARRHTWRRLDRRRREKAGWYRSSSENTLMLVNTGTEDIERWELTEWLDHGLSLVSKACRDPCPPFTWIPSSHLTPRLLPA